MKILKKILSLMLICILFSTTVHAQGETLDTNKDEIYEKVLEAYRKGDKMSEEVVTARKQAAEQLGLEAFLDERAFLSVDYRNEQEIGKDGAIKDPALDILIEMATEEEMQAVLAKSQMKATLARSQIKLNRMSERAFTPGQTVGVTQMPRVSGAGNGYFSIDGANSYGYCAENKKNFWSNYGTKYGEITEWDDAVARKILYYSPGGPGYAGNNLGYDMDNATFAVGYQNGSCNNNGRAKSYIASLEGKADPITLGFHAYKVNITPDSYQDVAFLGYAPSKGTLTLKKESANPGLTNGNSCYSLEGAVFGVYSSSSLSGASRVGTLTTDANGNSDTLQLDAKTYYVKELTAPKGFALDPNTKEVTVTADQKAVVTFKDLPQMDPVGILLGKVDAETNQNKPQGSATLQGAQFTVKYYAGLWEADKDPAAIGKTPVRTWVFQTDEDGFTMYDASYKVRGDDLYVSPNGDPSIPIGTLTIQETKAPEGYLINQEVFVRQITAEGNAEWVNTYNRPVVPEKVMKLDLVKRQEKTD
ncbi:MAG: collagen binding domain-containing protein, partial [Coprococcus phoceensis]